MKELLKKERMEALKCGFLLSLYIIGVFLLIPFNEFTRVALLFMLAAWSTIIVFTVISQFLYAKDRQSLEQGSSLKPSTDTYWSISSKFSGLSVIITICLVALVAIYVMYTKTHIFSQDSWVLTQYGVFAVALIFTFVFALLLHSDPNKKYEKLLAKGMVDEATARDREKGFSTFIKKQKKKQLRRKNSQRQKQNSQKSRRDLEEDKLNEDSCGVKEEE